MNIVHRLTIECRRAFQALFFTLAFTLALPFAIGLRCITIRLALLPFLALRGLVVGRGMARLAWPARGWHFNRNQRPAPMEQRR